MEALVTRVGERSSPYLLELYDVNCPFCARVALNTWRDLLSSGAYFELVYLPVHYAIWKDYSLRTAEGTYTANLSAFCIDDPVKRVEYVLRLFEVTASI
ncbi:MAG: disulfide bond formation protein DsbA, partial [Thermoproteus sp.]